MSSKEVSKTPVGRALPQENVECDRVPLVEKVVNKLCFNTWNWLRNFQGGGYGWGDCQG